MARAKSERRDTLEMHLRVAYWEADVYFDWLDKLANGTVSAEEVVERFRHYERVARHQELAGQPPCPACGLYDPRREVVAVRDGA